MLDEAARVEVRGGGRRRLRVLLAGGMGVSFRAFPGDRPKK